MINLNEVVDQMTGNAEAMRALMQVASEDQVNWKPDPDTWSLKEVMEHVYNEERGDFRSHLQEMLADPVQPWGSEQPDYISVDECRLALEGFLLERKISTAYLTALESPAWDTQFQIPFGPQDQAMTLCAGDVLVSWVEHDFLHLRQMVELQHAWNVKQSSPYSVAYGGGW